MSAFGGSYATNLFDVEDQNSLAAGNSTLRRLRLDHVEVWSTETRTVGMSVEIATMGDTLCCIHGDGLTGRAALPESCDPELLLNWCRDSFMRFCGALCSRDRLVLWTDELASCPLFYAFHSSGEPVFASEAKSLLGMLPRQPEFLDSPGSRPLPPIGATLFAGVYAVPSGTVLTLVRDGASGWRRESFSTFFELPACPEIVCLDQAQRCITDALTLSVTRAVRGLDEVSITLSGGVDSSSVAALARRSVKRLNSYTVGTPYGDEFQQAAEVASFLKSEHHELLMTEDDLQRLLPELISSMETWDPLTLQIAAPVAFLYSQLTGRPRVFLTGYGADLIFAGVLNLKASEAWLEQTIREQLILTAPTNELSPVLAHRYGVTVRYPFMTADMLTAGLMVRARLKVYREIEKYVLRSAVESLLPHHVAWRPKVGIHEGSAMQKMFTEVLGDPSHGGQTRKLRQLAEDVLLGRAHQPFSSYSKEQQSCVYY